MVGGEPSPQSIVTVLVSLPPGLMIVPLTVTVPSSAMLDDESTRPGAANSGAGSLMATVVCATAVSPACRSGSRRWCSSRRPSRRCSRAGRRRHTTRREASTGRGEPSPQSIVAVSVADGAGVHERAAQDHRVVRARRGVGRSPRRRAERGAGLVEIDGLGPRHSRADRPGRADDQGADVEADRGAEGVARGGRGLLLGGDRLAEGRARRVGVEEVGGAGVAASPSVAPAAPIKAVFCVPATEAPKWPPPPSGWTNVVSSHSPSGPNRNAAPAPGPRCCHAASRSGRSTRRTRPPSRTRSRRPGADWRSPRSPLRSSPSNR